MRGARDDAAPCRSGDGRRCFLRQAAGLGVGGWTWAAAAQAVRAQARPASAAAPFAQYRTWDGGSGPNAEYWSAHLALKWMHAGTGDWLDAAGREQGAEPFAQARVGGGPLALNVTGLVTKALKQGHSRGFLLRSREAWPFEFAGRLHPDAATQPVLELRTATGVRRLPALCNAAWTPSSRIGGNTQRSFQVARGLWSAIVQFDLQGVEQPVREAVLRLHCINLRTPGQLEVYEANPPRWQADFGGASREGGLAQRFPLDRGVLAHPDVLFAADFSRLNDLTFGKRVAAGTEQVKDPATGSVYLRGLIPRGEQLGADLLHNLIEGGPDGVPRKVEPELYMRYLVYLEDDFGSEVDACKMPGFDARFGSWNAHGYWQHRSGFGGRRPNGMKQRSDRNAGWDYEGASMRGHIGGRSRDGNPYDGMFWVAGYLYHLDQASPFGDSVRWGRAVLRTGRWYSIEQHLRMNSITGPHDALGNGTAIRDGVYRVWIDGELVFSRHDLRWRRHSEMGVQGIWLNWYHGGTAPAPRAMHFRMDSVVVARSYIGPRA